MEYISDSFIKFTFRPAFSKVRNKRKKPLFAQHRNKIIAY